MRLLNTSPSVGIRLVRRSGGLGVLSLCLVIGLAAPVGAAGEGQADLDAATLAKLTAKTMDDLEKAIQLCDSALEKGLDQQNETYAKDLLSALLYERASRLSALIFDRRPIDPRWETIRRVAMSNLDRALEINSEMGSAQLLVARLLSLPGGNRERAAEAADKAVRLLQDQPEELAKAYVARGGLATKPDQMLADFERAIELNPREMDAWRARGLYYLRTGEYQRALDDFQKLLERDADDLTALQAVAQTLKQMKQYDKALEHLDQIITQQPRSAVPYTLRSQILEETGKTREAIDSLNEAIRVSPQNVGALLSRARLRIIEQEYDLARSDVERILQLQKQLPQAILLRSLISAAEKRYDEAIGDLRQLLRLNPDNVDLKVQIASYYEAKRQPSLAIEIYDEVLEAKPDLWTALRRRGDAHLSKGDHKAAIRDYEAALQLQPDDSGLLNNLAWVLATSPSDDIRDGSRAIELARKACEVTDYKAAHILSTLAAGHAEVGDFEKAIEWSSKAVELDSEQEQLARELESYRERKPWRELQNVEEVDSPGSSLDELDLDSLEDLEAATDSDHDASSTPIPDQRDAGPNDTDADDSDTSDPRESEADEDRKDGDSESSDPLPLGPENSPTR